MRVGQERGPSSQRGDRGAGRGRGDRGRGNGRTKSYINDVDVTDPNHNFTAAEWEKHGTMRSFVLQIVTAAAVVTVEAMTTGLPPVQLIARPAQRLRPTTTTMTIIRTMHPWSRRLRSAGCKTGAVSAVEPITTTDPRPQVEHGRCGP